MKEKLQLKIKLFENKNLTFRKYVFNNFFQKIKQINLDGNQFSKKKFLR